MGSERAESPRSYTGLLLDYGGVLTTNLFDSFAAFCEHEGLPRDALARAFRENNSCKELLIALETGRLGEQEFEVRLGAILGVEPKDMIVRLFAGSEPDPLMSAGVREARRAGVRTGLISNSWGTTRYDRELLDELFDAVVISGEVGIRKPAPGIYKMALERLEVAPGACVFVDDLPFNLAPAAAMGMATIHHVSSEQTVAELERLLGLQLRHSVG